MDEYLSKTAKTLCCYPGRPVALGKYIRLQSDVHEAQPRRIVKQGKGLFSKPYIAKGRPTRISLKAFPKYPWVVMRVWRHVEL